MQAKNPFLDMVDQKLLDRNVFSLRLARKDEEHGTLTFGSVDDRLYTGKLTSFPATNVTNGDNEAIAVYSSSGWQVSLQAISLGSNSSSGSLHASLPNFTAILSTNFPHIGLPAKLAWQFTQHCGATQYLWPFDCEARTSLPNLTLTLGADGRDLVLTPWDYMFEVEHENEGTKCILSFIEIPEMLDNLGYVMLGTAFLTSFYSVFDYDNQTVSCKFPPTTHSQDTFIFMLTQCTKSCVVAKARWEDWL